MSSANESCSTNPCERCETQTTPKTIYNAPNLPSLDYRVGEHASFKKTMLSELTQQNELRALATNSDQDPTIALLDASSVTLDILTFYQQRFANEHYLGTASERYSINELAKRIGYKLSPGVAAAGYLAFTLLDAPGSPTSVIIPDGAQIQSQPKDDESPQTFETMEEFEARAAWNAFTPLMARWSTPIAGQTEFHLEGTSTSLAPGDPVLLVSAEAENTNIKTEIRSIATINEDATTALTRIALDQGIGAAFLGDNANDRSYRLFALRQRSAVFGYNEIAYTENTDDNGNVYLTPRAKTNEERTELVSPVALDNAYKNIAVDSWVVFKKSGSYIATTLTDVTEDIASNTLSSMRVTRLSVDGGISFTDYNEGNTTVYFQAEELSLAPSPLTDEIEDDTIEVQVDDTDFEEGRLIALTGTDADTSESLAEIASIESISSASALLPDGSTEIHTTLHLDEALSGRFQRDSVSISANVAYATHGKSRFEILGSGDGSKINQSFHLKNAPLTYIPADTDTGAASTLKIKVDNIEWKEADTHFGADSDDATYTVEMEADLTAKITHGDGQRARRLTTGSNNVTAEYREGIGKAGILDEGQLHILLTRPLGLQSVINPAATFGGEDPEDTEDARTNAPLKVLTIDRIVSLNDFANFARAYVGIAKATAQWIWNGSKRIIFLTVAGNDGATPQAEQLDLLSSSIDKRRDPFQPVEMESFDPVYFKINARVWIDETYDQELVVEEAIALLLGSYDFDKREFCEPVYGAEIIAQLQSIDGVVGIDLESLEYEDPSGRELIDQAARSTRLIARPARYQDNDYHPAEILMIDPADTEAIILTPLEA